MRALSSQARSSLAAEYALGTLRGLARVRFARLLKNDASLRGEVTFWQERFSEFATQLAPVVPRDVVWASLERSLAADASKVVPLRPKRAAVAIKTNSRNLGLWQAWAAVASVTSAILGVGFWMQAGRTADLQAAITTAQAQPMPYLAVIQPAGGDARWAVSLYPEKNLMRVSLTSGRMPVDSSRSLELWMLDSKGKPHSLGLLPMEGGSEAHDMALPDLSSEQLGAALSLAVSEEPRGGSPTGLPTGKVLGAMPAVRPI